MNTNSHAKCLCLVHMFDIFKNLMHINIVRGKQFVGDLVISTLPQSRHSLDILARLP